MGPDYADPVALRVARLDHVVPLRHGPRVTEPAGDPKKKHRHDVGLPDHGPVSTEGLTRAIQGLLLLLLAATGALVIYAIALASR
jgi:hypothetical protein